MRVDCITSGPSGADSANKGGQGRRDGRRIMSRVGKRSFKRAVARAELNGQTFYKGRILYPSMQFARAPRFQQTMQQPRLHVFSWNAGGLSSERAAELEHFLNSSQYAIALVQETHWSTSGEWNKGALRTSLLSLCGSILARDYSWQAPSGQGCHSNQQWEIFSLYQHAVSPGSAEDKAKLLAKRGEIWRKLDKAVHNTPLRSMLLLGGDFNMSLKPQPPCVGFGVIQGSVAADLEQERLLVNDILAKRRLAVLNSWSRRQPTYEHPTGSTQIDFLVVRQQVADGVAKQSGPITSGLAGWRHSGHSVLAGKLRMHWRPWQAIAPAATKQTVLPLKDPRESALVKLRQSVKQQCSGRALRQRLLSLAGVTQEIECHWRLRQTLREIGGSATLRQVFNALLLNGKAQKARRELKRACLLHGLRQIEDASSRGDSKSFHAFVKLVSPKPFVPKIKLRDESGVTMTRHQEGEALKKYAEKLFGDEKTSLPSLVPVPAELFAKRRWEWALMRIRSGKAVPTGAAQIATWQSSVADVAHVLEAISTDMLCCSNPVIPSLWTRVQIAWLPKPGKTPSCPEHLRTIGLMGADMKAFMILLKSEAHPYIMNMLQHTSQFAYRSGVSTLDAILRVGQHFSDVRRDIESTSTSHLSKLLGDHIPELTGGLAISLDLSKAFDCLPYAEMFDAMAHSGMPEYLIRLILQVHAQSVCEIVHGNYFSSVEMKRGLRQGCPIAPVIYSAWTALLCKRLVAALGEGWDSNTITLYADDKILCWRIRSIVALEKSLKQVGFVLDLLSRAKMKVNITKSEALLLLTEDEKQTRQSADSSAHVEGKIICGFKLMAAPATLPSSPSYVTLEWFSLMALLSTNLRASVVARQMLRLGSSVEYFAQEPVSPRRID